MAIFEKHIPAREVRGRYAARDVCVARQTTFQGPMRKYAGWRTEHSAFSHLDDCAHTRVTYTAPTVRRRRYNA